MKIALFWVITQQVMIISEQHIDPFFNVLLTCIVVYPYNETQQDVLFIFNLFQ